MKLDDKAKAEIKAKLKENFELDDIECPVCGEYKFLHFGDYCPVCGWEHDVIQSFDYDFEEFANTLSLNEYKKIFEKLRLETPNYRWENDPKKYERFLKK